MELWLWAHPNSIMIDVTSDISNKKQLFCVHNSLVIKIYATFVGLCKTPQTSVNEIVKVIPVRIDLKK